MKQHIKSNELIEMINTSYLGKEAFMLLDTTNRIVAYNRQAGIIAPALKMQNNDQRHDLLFKSCSFVAEDPMESSFSLEEALANGSLSDRTIIRFIQQDGTSKWAEGNLQNIQTEEGINFTLLTMYEITTRYNTQQALQKEISNMNTLISSIDDIIFEVSREGVVINGWTSTPEQLFLPKEQMIGKSVMELFPKDYAQSLYTIIQNTLLLKQNQYLEYQSPFTPNDGKWFRLQTKLIPNRDDHITVVINNINREMKMKSQALFQEQKFNRAFHHSSMGMLLIDLKGIIMECNGQFAAILGYDNTAEIVGKNILDFTFPQDHEKSTLLLRNLNTGQTEKSILEKRYLHKTDKIVSCLLTVSVIHSIGSAFSFYLAQVQDLSLFKQLEQRLINKQDQLEHTNLNLKTRLNQLEAFYQIIAHNLRTPASNIKMITQQLKKLKLPNEGERFVPLLEQSSDRLLAVLNDLTLLLEQYADEEIVFESCNIEELTKETLNAFERLQDYRMTFKLKQSSVTFPKALLQAILFHLFEFAAQHALNTKKNHLKIITWKKNEFTYLRFLENITRNYGHKNSSLFIDALRSMQPHSDRQSVAFFMAKSLLESLGGKMWLESCAAGIKFTVCFPNTPFIAHTEG